MLCSFFEPHMPPKYANMKYMPQAATALPNTETTDTLDVGYFGLLRQIFFSVFYRPGRLNLESAPRTRGSLIPRGRLCSARGRRPRENPVLVW